MAFWRAAIRVIRVCHKSGNCEVDMTVKNQIVMTVKRIVLRIVYGAVRCCYWKSDISLICVPHLDTQPLWCRFFKECMVTVNLGCLWLGETRSAEDSRHVDFGKLFSFNSCSSRFELWYYLEIVVICSVHKVHTMFFFAKFVACSNSIHEEDWSIGMVEYKYSAVGPTLGSCDVFSVSVRRHVSAQPQVHFQERNTCIAWTKGNL